MEVNSGHVPGKLQAIAKDQKLPPLQGNSLATNVPIRLSICTAISNGQVTSSDSMNKKQGLGMNPNCS